MDSNATAINIIVTFAWAFALVVLFLGIAIVCIGYVINKKKYQRSEYYAQTNNHYLSVRLDKGRLGEYYTYKYLKPLEGSRKFLFNCYIPKDDGTTTELDVIMIHTSGIYVFESKNYSGWIFGSENQQRWTQTLSTGRGRAKKSHFLNPIIQNKVHLKWLQKYLGEENVPPFYSYIVFSDRCILKDITLTSSNHHVINRYDLLPAVRKNAALSGIKLSEEDINALYDKLCPLTQADEALKNAHVENILQKHSLQIHTAAVAEPPIPAQEKACPRCGAKMIYRTASRGERAGKHFWGCSDFPKCRYIENIEE